MNTTQTNRQAMLDAIQNAAAEDSPILITQPAANPKDGELIAVSTSQRNQADAVVALMMHIVETATAEQAMMLGIMAMRIVQARLSELEAVEHAH